MTLELLKGARTVLWKEAVQPFRKIESPQDSHDAGQLGRARRLKAFDGPHGHSGGLGELNLGHIPIEAGALHPSPEFGHGGLVG